MMTLNYIQRSFEYILAKWFQSATWLAYATTDLQCANVKYATAVQNIQILFAHCKSVFSYASQVADWNRFARMYLKFLWM